MLCTVVPYYIANLYNVSPGRMVYKIGFISFIIYLLPYKILERNQFVTRYIFNKIQKISYDISR